MIKVYATCFWQDDASLLETIRCYGFGSTVWKNIEFINGDDFDVVVVLTAPWHQCRNFNPSDAICFLTEPPSSHHHRNCADVVCQMYLPLPWWIDYPNKNEVIKVGVFGNKTKLASSVTSELVYLDGHRKRLTFLAAFDSLVAEGLDIYGKQYTGSVFAQMGNYRGELKIKYDGIIPYEYHINCENSFLNGYFTEKLLDAVVGESYCFYDGCSNVEQYIDHRAFTRIDVMRIEESIETIINCINEGYYQKQLPFILREKRRILYFLNPLNIIWAQLNEYDTARYFLIN
ncbi:hypothetical protein BN938_0577 [Mucinivorans hirudinis]|uniref:Uncharacterized protein n=1 Tax=Mucinivorans hirudinis TaxID=1433126 RepID=A0A060R6P4_9BACT|nr:hypothetical protein BN938_0303 [Mucinivorans hirudinis]CDN30682.1 hypothetical protein BN938_0577 [Mucinivorans hirudinis]